MFERGDSGRFRFMPFNSVQTTAGVPIDSIAPNVLAAVDVVTGLTVHQSDLTSITGAQEHGFKFVLPVDLDNDGAQDKILESGISLKPGDEVYATLNCYKPFLPKIYVIDGYKLDFEQTYSIKVKLFGPAIYDIYSAAGRTFSAVYTTEERIGTVNDPDYGKFVIFMRKEINRIGNGLVVLKAYDDSDNELVTDQDIQNWATSHPGIAIKMRVFVYRIDCGKVPVNAIYDCEVNSELTTTGLGFKTTDVVTVEQDLQKEQNSGIKLLYEEFQGSFDLGNDPLFTGNQNLIDEYKYLIDPSGQYHVLVLEHKHKKHDYRTDMINYLYLQFATQDSNEMNNLVALLRELFKDAINPGTCS